MSKPRYRWWGYVKNVIRAYPELERRAAEPPPVSLTAKYGPTTPSGGEGRPVEDVAVKRLSGRDMTEYEAVRAAIRDTARLPNGEVRLKVIDLVYWKRSHTLWGAGREVLYSYAQVKRFQEKFICLVAENLDLKEKMSHKSQKPVSK